MPPKRRIHVAFEGSHGDQKRQRKLIVFIDKDATVEQLATEISTRIDQVGGSLLLQLDGFELLGKDSIDIIRDGELVVATSKDTKPMPMPMLDKSHITHPGPSRMQVRTVTSDPARNFAQENPKQQVEPTNRISDLDSDDDLYA